MLRREVEHEGQAGVYAQFPYGPCQHPGAKWGTEHTASLQMRTDIWLHPDSAGGELSASGASTWTTSLPLGRGVGPPPLDTADTRRRDMGSGVPSGSTSHSLVCLVDSGWGLRLRGYWALLIPREKWHRVWTPPQATQFWLTCAR